MRLKDLTYFHLNFDKYFLINISKMSPDLENIMMAAVIFRKV